MSLLVAMISIASAQLPDAAPLQKAIAAYEAGELKTSIEQLAPVTDATDVDSDTRGVARMYLAAAHHGAGDAAISDAHVAVLVREHPNVAPDASVFPPDFVQSFDRVRATILARRPAPRAHPIPVASWIAGTASLATAGVGGYFGYQSYRLAIERERQPSGPGYEALHGEVMTAVATANVAYGVAAASAVAAIVLWRISVPRSAAVGVWPSSSGATVTVAANF